MVALRRRLAGAILKLQTKHAADAAARFSMEDHGCATLPACPCPRTAGPWRFAAGRARCEESWVGAAAGASGGTCRRAGSILASFGLLATQHAEFEVPGLLAAQLAHQRAAAAPQRLSIFLYRDIVQYSPAVSQVYRIFKAIHINKIEEGSRSQQRQFQRGLGPTAWTNRVNSCRCRKPHINRRRGTRPSNPSEALALHAQARAVFRRKLHVIASSHCPLEGPKAQLRTENVAHQTRVEDAEWGTGGHASHICWTRLPGMCAAFIPAHMRKSRVPRSTCSLSQQHQ